MKISAFILIYSCFFISQTYSQRNNSVEAIFNRVWKEKESATGYTSILKKVDSRDKHYSVAQYLIHHAYVEKARARTGFTPYKQTTAYYDSAIIFLEKCQAAIEIGNFSKEIDFYLPMVNDYGIYESEPELKQDLYAVFDKTIIELKREKLKFNELAAAFSSVMFYYSNAISEFESLRNKYPYKDDLLILAKQTYFEEISPLVTALNNLELSLEQHQQKLLEYGTNTSFPINKNPVISYDDSIVSADEFSKSGSYSAIEQWLDLVQLGRVEKLGNFWSSFTQLYDSLNLQLIALKRGNIVKSQIEVSNDIIEKIKFINPVSAIIPYLNYLEQKQFFLFQSRYQTARNDLQLIELFGILQQSKLSLDILNSRLAAEGKMPSKDDLLFEKINVNSATLKVFVASESDFLKFEENKISSSLKASLVNNFMEGRFNPGFTQYDNILIPLYEQEVGFLKEGQAITTSVLQIAENKMLIGGTMYSKQYTPFVALVENKKIVWIERGIFSESALSFADNFDYFHCSALFETSSGWGGVYYPGKFSSSNVSEKQSGLLVLFDKNGKKVKMLPLPVMRRVDAVCLNEITGGYVLFAENDYLADSYYESEVLYMGSNGEVKWVKNLPVKSFSSILKLKQENIFLFTNSMEQVPGENHFNSNVHVFELNGEGVIMKEKKLDTKGASYTTQVIQDKKNHWLIFGFNGNNDLYNLRDKDVFFYMLDQTFDNVGGGELTSVENP